MILALVRMVLVFTLTLKDCLALAWAEATGNRHPKRSLQRAHRWGSLLSSLLGLKIEISGNLPEGPVVFVANHRSYTDIVAWLSLKPSLFLAKREVSSWPILGSAARNAHTIFVRRESRKSRARAKNEIGRLVESGESVTVFCEGTTHAGPGKLPFLPGVFYLAAQRDLAIVPVAIQYASKEDAWIDNDSLGRHFFNRFVRPTMHVSIAVGPALKDRDGAVLKESAETWISDQLQQLQSAERRLPCRELPVTGLSLSAARPAA